MGEQMHFHCFEIFLKDRKISTDFTGLWIRLIVPEVWVICQGESYLSPRKRNCFNKIDFTRLDGCICCLFLCIWHLHVLSPWQHHHLTHCRCSWKFIATFYQFVNSGLIFSEQREQTRLLFPKPKCRHSALPVLQLTKGLQHFQIRVLSVWTTFLFSGII